MDGIGSVFGIVETAEMERIDREKSPFWEPKKLIKTSVNSVRDETYVSDLSPSHHDTEALHFLQINLLGILLQSAAVGWVQTAPRDGDHSILGIARLCLRW